METRTQSEIYKELKETDSKTNKDFNKFKIEEEERFLKDLFNFCQEYDTSEEVKSAVLHRDLPHMYDHYISKKLFV